MFYNEESATRTCEDIPLTSFEVIKNGYGYILFDLIKNKALDINLEDENKNNILMSLAINKDFETLLKLINNKDFDINKQNEDGDTLSHLILKSTGIKILEIYKNIKKKEDFNPHIKNKKGEGLIDIAIKTNSLRNIINVITDNKYCCMNINSFANIYENYLKSKSFGFYTKIDILDAILKIDIKKMDLEFKKLIISLKENYELIKEELSKGKTTTLENIVLKAL